MKPFIAMTDTRPRVAQCPLCQLGDSELTEPTVVGEVIAIHTDPDVVVFLQPKSRGVAVAPAAHVPDLSLFDEASLGLFLAALRRVAVDVGLVFGCSGTTIAPTERALPKSEGHVCFQVLPSVADNAEDLLGSNDPMLRAGQLAERLH
jgi:hypothetical protein